MKKRSDELEIYALKDEIFNTNKKICEELRNPEVFNSGLLKIVFSEYLIDDAFLIISLYEMNEDIKTKNRNVKLMIRNMLEQIIEFLFLLKKPNFIKQFFGKDIDIKSFELEEFIDSFHQIGRKRYYNGRYSIAKMAQCVGEIWSREDRPSLYEIYKILSEECHNSYFFSTLDKANEFETGKKGFALKDMEVHMYFLELIIDRFMESYRG